MPYKPFPIPKVDEPTSVKFWTDMNALITHINALEAQLTALQATLAAHMATPKAHG